MDPLGFVTSQAPAPRPGMDAVMRQVAERLVGIRAGVGRYVFDLPIILASGAKARVTVWPQDDGDQFIVTDDGAAFLEVDCGSCNISAFRRVAKERSEAAGARFDGQTMLFLEVTAPKLPVAVALMGSLVKEVVDETILRSAVEKADTLEKTFVSRLSDLFGSAKVHSDVELVGSSTVVHRFSALVETNRGRTAFDVFNHHGGSINAAFTKFSDLHLAEEKPRLVGVTRNRELIGPKLTLISTVASVVEADLSDISLKALAA